MATNKKNNNLLYTAVVLAGLVLLLLPFFIFNIGSELNGTSHLTRFALHLLAFTGAILAGSLVSTGFSSAATTSAATVKIATIAATVVVATAVTYNTVQYARSEKKIVLNQPVQVADSLAIATDSIATDLSQAGDSLLNGEHAFETKSKIPQNAKPEDIEETTNFPVANDPKTSVNQNQSTSNNSTKTAENKNSTTDKTVVAATLSETCNSFQILHGSQQLDRKLGLSIFDPNKTIRFQNECGCILKDAAMSISRGNNVLEQKIQTGNFINLHTFKDLQADDRLTVEIRQANCKDSKGISFLYTFPKPILSIVLISDHREFETAAELKNKKTAKEITNTPAKTFQKDKVEEKVNKYGN